MSDFEVFFVRNLQEPFWDESVRAILVRAADDNWNDFGYQSLFDYAILNGAKPIWRRFRLGFADVNESPYELVEKIFQSKNSDFLPASELPEFFSMQLGKDEYQQLRMSYGVEMTKLFLLNLQDVAALHVYAPSNPLLRKAISTDIFALSLIRTDAAFDAYRNALSVILGQKPEDVVSAPTNLKLPEFRIGEWRNNANFEFNFSQDSLIPKRVAVIIGPNGSGKSMTLRNLCASYLDSSLRQRLPTIAKLVAVCIPGDTALTFPAPAENSLFYVRISSLGAETSQFQNISLSRAVYILSRDQWSNNEKERIRWTIFQRAVAQILPFSSLAFLPKSDVSYGRPDIEDRALTFKQLMSSSEYSRKSGWGRTDDDLVLCSRQGNDYSPLSSGQASFVRLAAQLALNITDGTLVLIDEPETHLHPKFVSQFMAMLDSILGATKSIAIIATHSPYVVREVVNDQVRIVYVKSTKKVEIVRPRLRTFGADIGAISESVFGDDLATESADKIVDSILENVEKYRNWEKELYTDLSVETVLYIRRRLRERGVKSQHVPRERIE